RSKLKDDWDVAMLPKGKAGSISWIAGSGFGISAGTKFKNEAWQVLKYLTSTEGLNKVAAAGRGYPGRNSSVQAFYRKDVPPPQQELLGKPATNANASPTHKELVAKQATNAKPYRTNSTWQEIDTQLKRDLVDPVVITNKPVAEVI